MKRKQQRTIHVRSTGKRQLDRQHPPPKAEPSNPEKAAAQVESALLAETSSGLVAAMQVDLLQKLRGPENAEMRMAYLVLDNLVARHLSNKEADLARSVIAMEMWDRLEGRSSLPKKGSSERPCTKTFIQMVAASVIVGMAKAGYEKLSDLLKTILADINKLL